MKKIIDPLNDDNYNLNDDNEDNEAISFSQKINKIFKDSIEIESTHSSTNNNNSKQKVWSKIKMSFNHTKNTLKFNSINAKSSMDWNKNQPFVNFFYNKYNINIPSEVETLSKKLSSMIFISYRSNFRKIRVPNEKGDHLSNDCGWGCVIRSCQMMFARALYKLFRKRFQGIKINKESAIFNSLTYFLESPFSFEGMPNTFASIISKFLTTMYSTTNNNSNSNSNNVSTGNDNSNDSSLPSIEILSIQPPFSIQTICEVGTLFNKTPGHYYSDTQIPQIFRAINSEFNAIANFSIFSFQTIIDKSKLMEECFTTTNPKEDSEEISFELNSDEIDYALGFAIQYDHKKYYFEKDGLIFVSVRLGINKISNEYYESLKELYQCKQFVGFVGGKDVYAYYFFGYNDKYLYYLDPHVNQEAILNLNMTTYLTYSPKKISQMKFSKLKPALTLAFLFRSMQEYNDMITWIEEYSKRPFACITITECIKSGKVCPVNGEMNKEGNDF